MAEDISGDVAVEPSQFETDTDATGNWTFDFENNLTPGMHTMVVQDEDGAQKEVGIYVMRNKEVGLIERVKEVMPPIFIYATLLGILIIIVLAIDTVRLARTAEKTEHQKKRHHYFQHAILFCSVALAIIIAVGLIVDYKTRMYSRFADTIQSGQKLIVKVSGAVIDPLTLQGVTGVDLNSGVSTIRTGQGGYYSFDDVDAFSGIKITHPEIHRALIYLPGDKAKEQKMDIYFEAKMYNKLIDYINFEAESKWAGAYNLLAAEVQQKITVDDFSKEAKSIFTKDNIMDQELVIVKVEPIRDWFIEKFALRFGGAVKITVFNNGAKADYYLIKAGDEWRIADKIVL
jgi:heme/copper-type cytochrome/quinol oxidase subunit 2